MITSLLLQNKIKQQNKDQGLMGGRNTEKYKETGKPLNPKEWQHYELIQKTIVTHNTRIFRFGLADSKQSLGNISMRSSFFFFL